MTRLEERQAEGWGRKVGAFLSGLFADKKNWLIAFMLLGFGADKASGFIEPKETYWNEKDIAEIIQRSIQDELNRPGGKMDRVAFLLDALVKTQDKEARLAIYEDLARYDRRASNPNRREP